MIRETIRHGAKGQAEGRLSSSGLHIASRVARGLEDVWQTDHNKNTAEKLGRWATWESGVPLGQRG